MNAIDNSSIDTAEKQVWSWLNEIPDPEIPVLNIVELGMIRELEIKKLEESKILSIAVGITPTYSACPAVDLIKMQVQMKLSSHGIPDINIYEILTPAWTTDWMSDTAREKLRKYGIAPPNRKSKNPLALFEEDEVPCPKCNSKHTKKIAAFGSTSCKALFQCEDCKEPFEHFKCH